MKGKVKWYNFKKGFGFISGEDGKDYFVHFTAVPKGTMLREEDEVNFDAVETDKGIQAQNISIGKGASKQATEQAQEEAPGETPEDSEDF
jgi:CspA family cold shock protein